MPPVNPTGKVVYLCDEVLYSQGAFLDDRLLRLH
jgi:hypothetical protein